MIEKLGIHGNERCIRCGACCVYFSVSGDFTAGVEWKAERDVCRYMIYDSATRIAICAVHDPEDESKPSECSLFSCNSEKLDERDKNELRRIAANMPEIFRRGGDFIK